MAPIRPKKKIKTGNGHDQMKDVIVLPHFIQKKIIELIFVHQEIEYLHRPRYADAETKVWKNGRLKRPDDPSCMNVAERSKYNRAIYYALVSKQWYKMVKEALNALCSVDIDLWGESVDTECSNRLVDKDSLQHLMIEYKNLNMETVDRVNKEFKSLQQLTVIKYADDYGLEGSVWSLNCLNKLKRRGDILVNFDLVAIGHGYPSSIYQDEQQKEKAWLFKTNRMGLYCSYEDQDEDPFQCIYGLIKGTNPRSLAIYAGIKSNDISHLKMYHSIAKLNHQYQHVAIESDFIPLYALYRFLQAPSLKSFQFRLQLHFLSHLYEQDDLDDKTVASINFDTLDSFTYDSKAQSCVRKMPRYLKTHINEDNSVFCEFNTDLNDDDPDEILSRVPPYSKLLWKECLGLLSTNSTITNLCIGDVHCYASGHPHETTQPLVDDLLHALSSNRTITTLQFAFGFAEDHMILNKQFIVSLLQKNNTLQSLQICYFPYYNYCSRSGYENPDIEEHLQTLLTHIHSCMPAGSKCSISIRPIDRFY
ncbi:hypothetical protein CYY_009195 [Polysphondylium violaceum]|uniref:Uncharacterized protein n=1 Tax=Polysphondylium violaceum TaxID=133409 RepID=A0A8J4PME7_9MYCE|nr:hypothetical protein CYY_009195 [Polysphondylium violaceum]